jgi:hypothetical protein
MLNINDIEEIKTDLCVMRNKIAELRSIGLNDFNGLEEPDGADDFCNSIYSLEEDVSEALFAIETIIEEMEN